MTLKTRAAHIESDDEGATRVHCHGHVKNGPLEAGEISQRVPLDGEQFGIRRGSLKFIIAPDERTQELFDLVADPNETNNLYDKRPQEATALKQELERWVGAYTRRGPATAHVKSDDQKRLESLGYIQ